MKRVKKTVETPRAASIKFDELEYFKLQSMALKAETTLSAAQAQVDKAIAARNAYIAELRAKYPNIPETFRQIQWNDETCEFAFS